MLKPDYVRIILQSDLPEKVAIARLIKPGIFGRGAPASQLPVGTSVFGGQPDLPPEIRWPTWAGVPQTFIAQVNLAELPQVEESSLLPERGRLYFFYAYDCEEDRPYLYSDEFPVASGHPAPVFYSAAPRSTLTRTPFTEGLHASQQLTAEHLTFAAFNTIPDPGHPAWARLGLNFEDLDWDKYHRYWDLFAQAGCPPEMKEPRSNYQILGYPSPMQDSVNWEIEYSVSPTNRDPAGHAREDRQAWRHAHREQAEQWELLFQAVDCIHDCSLYYMIRREHLLARRFERAWFCLQCT